jgi:hypothetical protein
MSLYTIVFLLCLAIITIYIVYTIVRSSNSNDVLTTMTTLTKKTDIVMADKTFSTLLGTSGSTVIAFIKLDEGDRTMTYTNKYIPLLQIPNNWYLEILPSKNGVHATSTRLRIATKNHDTKKEEIITLPDLVKQKWICGAILREGRRFDVIYDNKIVASHNLEYYPAIENGSSLAIGNKGLNGSIIHVIINNIRMTPSDIDKERLKYIDTNNNIIESNDIDMSFPFSHFFSQCPPGLPCDPIKKPPSQFLKWNTPYA